MNVPIWNAEAIKNLPRWQYFDLLIAFSLENIFTWQSATLAFAKKSNFRKTS